MFYASRNSGKVAAVLLQGNHIGADVSLLPLAVSCVVMVAGFGLSAQVDAGKGGCFRVSVHSPFTPLWERLAFC